MKNKKDIDGTLIEVRDILEGLNFYLNKNDLRNIPHGTSGHRDIQQALEKLDAFIATVPKDLVNRSKGHEIYTGNNGCGVLVCDDVSDIKAIFYTAHLLSDATKGKDDD